MELDLTTARKNARSDEDAAAIAWAQDEIERLEEIVHRLNGLAMSAAGHISNKGIGDDFRSKICLCQTVDLEPERIRAAKHQRELAEVIRHGPGSS